MIETERLIIRDFVLADWPAVHFYGANPEVSRFQHWGPNSEADSEAFVKTTIFQQSESPRLSYELAIIEKRSRQLIGGVGLRIKSIIHRDADMGYTLRRDRWGFGFGTEAAQGILNYGFHTLKLHRIWATVAPDNHASIRILKKIGMQEEGMLRSNLWVRGTWRDSLLFAIIESDVR